MAKSLRWRLQIWHAAILSLVVGGFAAVVYFQFRRSLLDEVDAELLSGARILEGVLRTMPGEILEHGFGNPPPNSFDNRPDRPERSPNPRRLPPPMRRTPEPWEQALRLPPPMIDPRGPRDQPAYFAVFSGNGQLLKAVPADFKSTRYLTRQPIEFRVVEFRRELVLQGPRGTTIVVGKDVRPHFDGLNWLAVQLAATGFCVLGVGLIGGWWLSGRAIRPIQQIHETAARIDASNLSERIDTESMDRELKDLGSILNSMLARLQQAFEQQVRFTADASHELRTPISVLIAHTELALARSRSTSDYQATIATCHRAGERMKSLVEDLLILARADAGKLELRLLPVDLSKIAEEARQMLRPIAEQRSVELILDCLPAECLGDADRLLQVATNLISNAIQYNRSGGQVHVTTLVSGPHAVMQVRDTGVGIAPSNLPHLFERFYRVDEARSRDSGGSGLGLAICHSIVEAHHGTITAASEIDVGSVFELRIPRCRSQVFLISSASNFGQKDVSAV